MATKKIDSELVQNLYKLKPFNPTGWSCEKKNTSSLVSVL